MGSKNDWPTFLTVAEVSAILRVSKMTVYRMCHDGDLKSILVGNSYRITEADVTAYIEAAGVA